ncbi:MAG: MaoC family dehydratase [Sulfuricaulis sp.]|nr:MaoC family dehydratase [Sulfuricaulis sp.]
MLTVRSLIELRDHIGLTLPPSDWLLIDQKMIDDFSQLTGDKNWYHVDVERAKRELPGGKTLAHGLLTLSLIPGMASQIVRVTHHGRALNYGFEKVRYPAPVHADSRVRLHMTVLSAVADKGGIMLTRRYVMELEGSERPAMSADMLSLIFESEDSKN